MAGINFVRRWVMGQMTKKADDGIMITLPDSSKVDLNVNITMDRLLRNGIDPDAFTNPQQVENALNTIDNRMFNRAIPANSAEGREITEKLFGKQKAPVFDLEGNRIPEGSGIMGGKAVKELMDSGQVSKGAGGMKKSKKVEDREMFQAANERLTSDVDTIIKNIKRLSPMDAMKEANLVIGRKGYYKNLSPEESKKILKDTEDHIFERNIPEDPEDFADGGVAGLLGERTGFRGGGYSYRSSKTNSPGHPSNRGKQSSSKSRFSQSNSPGHPSNRTTNPSTNRATSGGGGGGNNNTGGGGGGPPGTNTGGGGGGTTTTPTNVPSNFKELIKQKQIIDRLKSLGLVNEEDLALSGASKVGKGIYSFIKPKPDRRGFNFGVDNFDILNPGKADIYGNYFNKNFFTDSDFKVGLKQNLKEAVEGDINPQLQLERRLGNKNIIGTLDREGNLGLKFRMPFGNQPPGRIAPSRLAPNNLGAGITSQVDTPNMLMADALTTPTEGKLGLNLMDYSTLKNSGYSDGQIEELQLNPKMDAQEVIRDIKGQIFAAAEGGIARANFVGGGMGRRGFLKLLGMTGAEIAGLKSGLVNIMGKGAGKEAVKEVAKEVAGSGTPPPYFFKLVEKIKTMGDDTLATTDKAIAKKYKDYTMEEDFAGNIEIIKKGDDVAEDVYMSYKVDDVPLRGKKGSKRVEEYEEYTARPDAEGKMKDIEQGVPDEVVNEGSVFEDNMTEFGMTKKASGGIARMLGE